MVEVELFRIRIDDKRRDQLIILREKEGSRVLPIVIGVYEADAIKLKVSSVELPRPMTHDLLRNTIRELDAELDAELDEEELELAPSVFPHSVPMYKPRLSICTSVVL